MLVLFFIFLHSSPNFLHISSYTLHNSFILLRKIPSFLFLHWRSTERARCHCSNCKLPPRPWGLEKIPFSPARQTLRCGIIPIFLLLRIQPVGGAPSEEISRDILRSSHKTSQRGFNFLTVSSIQALGLREIAIVRCELSLFCLLHIGSGSWKNSKLSPRFRD